MHTRFLSFVNPRTETPMVACVISGSLAALLALLVSLRDLIEMMSIGTLLAYTLVSVCVLLLRYQPDRDGFTSFLTEEEEEERRRKEEMMVASEKDMHINVGGEDFSDNACGAKNHPSKGDDETLIGKSDSGGYQSENSGYGVGENDTEGSDSAPVGILKRVLGSHYYTLRVRLGLPNSGDRPTPATGRTVTSCVLLFFVLTFFLWILVIFGFERVSGGARWALMPFIMTVIVLMVTLVIIILRQPENPKKLPYMAPCVPFVPAAAMLVNIYLMLKLSSITWVRFVVWCSLGRLDLHIFKNTQWFGITFVKLLSTPIGVLIYFSYGMWNSSLELSAREQAARASSYQRYDTEVDDSFNVDDDFHPQEDEQEGQYQGWAAEERGYQYQNQYQYHEQRSDNSRSKGRTNRGFEELDNEEYSPE